MSKNRNRCVRTLPSNNLLYYHPPPELLHQSNYTNKLSPEKQLFGEHIQENNEEIVVQEENPLSSAGTVDSIILGINSLANSKSSSSSISWNDDYRNEATKKIQEELLKMDRVFSGLEPIPSNYDENEYKEWMETFPNLSVAGTSINYCSSLYYESDVDKQNRDEEEELIAIHPPNNNETFNNDCDIFQTTSELNQIKNEIKKTVIDKIYKNISDRLLNQIKRCKHSQQEKFKNDVKVDAVTNNSSDKLIVDLDNYLKISPVTQYVPRYLNERRQSSKSLINSQISSSKWLKDDSPEYMSLPFLADNFGVNNNNSSYFNKLVNANKSVVQKSAVPLRKSVNSIVLPPIKVNNHFRSISATPRHHINNKCSSALSMKIEEDFNKSTIELTKCLPSKKSSFKQTNLKKLHLFED